MTGIQVISDAVLPWRLPMSVCIADDLVVVQELFAGVKLTRLGVRCRETVRLDRLATVALPSTGELQNLDLEPSDFDTRACPMEVVASGFEAIVRHGDNAQTHYYSIVENSGPTIDDSQGRGFVLVRGYLGDFEGIAQALLEIQEASEWFENYERVVFHQGLTIQIAPPPGDDGCFAAISQEDTTLYLHPDFAHFLAQRGDLAEVIFHGAFHLYTGTTPAGPPPLPTPLS